ncbi:FecR domain-containing protein [Methylobacillus pratensis]
MNPSNTEATPLLPETVVDAAITWSVRLNYNQASKETRRQFQDWLQADPVHAIAWERINSLHQPFAEAGASSSLVLSALEQADRKRQQHLLKRRKTIQLLSVGTFALGTGWGIRAYTPWQRLVADASTRIGEQHTRQLADGTTLILNTDTAVRIDLAGENRIIMLLRGEIMVTTGADAGSVGKRPFLVYTPFGKLEALGTRFIVRLTADAALITVQEHAVALYPAPGPSHVVRAGESQWLRDDGTVPFAPQGLDTGSWTDGVISGKNIRLADLLAELARYRHGHLHCDDQVAELRVSGLFHVKDTDQALQFLAQTQPITITYRTRFWVSVGPR